MLAEHQSVSPPMSKPPLDSETLREVIDLALWAGQLLLRHGAATDRVEETVHRLGTGLGCDWMDILISPNAIIVTTISGVAFRTKVRRVVGLGVNLSIVDAINQLSHQVEAGQLDRETMRATLQSISTAPPVYNRWLVAGSVGTGCAAFSRLFGGDWPVWGVTLVAATIAMLVRQELTRRHVNALLITISTAFIAGVLASSATLFAWSPQPQIALASAVLLLVPGVHLINAVEDLIKGHLITGFARGVTGGLVSLAIALGLLLAMGLMGVRSL